MERMQVGCFASRFFFRLGGLRSTHVVDKFEEQIDTLEESLTSFHLSGPNEELSRNSQSYEEPANSQDSVVQFPCKKSRRQYTHKENGKMKMSEYGTGRGALDQGESDTNRSEKEP